jgi:molybdopterin/thiamine biosynthesis adenylyltransferase
VLVNLVSICGHFALRCKWPFNFVCFFVFLFFCFFESLGFKKNAHQFVCALVFIQEVFTMEISRVSHIRHQAIFPVVEWGRRRIDVIGVGATGSHVAQYLAKLVMYPSCIHVWDYDTVESHNIPNTTYMWSQVGMSKVDALAMNVAMATGLAADELTSVLSGNREIRANISVVPHNKAVGEDANDEIEGEVVFLLVDSMKARKQIVEFIRENCPFVKLIIEPRLGVNSCRIYTFNPTNDEEYAFWKSHWYEDPPVNPSVCNQEPTLPPVVLLLVGRILQQFSDWACNQLKGEENIIHPELILFPRQIGASF